MTALLMSVRRWAVPLVLALALAAVGQDSSALAAEDPALTLVKGPDETLELSLGDLKALPQAVVVTETEFTDGLVRYQGPLARDVLSLLGLDEARTVRVTAANDYFIDIPTSDFRSYDAVLALEADGRPLSRRDKGPIWLMYPLSDNPELQNPDYNARLIWQVVRIERK